MDNYRSSRGKREIAWLVGIVITTAIFWDILRPEARGITTIGDWIALGIISVCLLLALFSLFEIQSSYYSAAKMFEIIEQSPAKPYSVRGEPNPEFDVQQQIVWNKMTRLAKSTTRGEVTKSAYTQTADRCRDWEFRCCTTAGEQIRQDDYHTQLREQKENEG